jgi:uncharacterized membrane protein
MFVYHKTPIGKVVRCSYIIASTESSTATWTSACNIQLGLPNDEIEILSSGS